MGRKTASEESSALYESVGADLSEGEHLSALSSNNKTLATDQESVEILCPTYSSLMYLIYSYIMLEFVTHLDFLPATFNIFGFFKLSISDLVQVRERLDEGQVIYFEILNMSHHHDWEDQLLMT